MFTAQELKDAAQAQVDAEGSQRYLDAQDWFPAMNSAQQRAITAINWTMAERKGAEEALSELTETRICQTNFFGGLTLDSLWTSGTQLSPYKVWTVLAFYAEPSVAPSTPAFPLFPPSKSYILPTTIYVPGGENERPVRRMTMEQAAKARDNMYMDGNEVLAAGPLRTYGYYFMGNRTDNDALIVGNREVVFTPRSRFAGGAKYIAMSFVREPVPITDLTTEIAFPQSMKRTMADWTLQYLSIKQGDQTTLNSSAGKDAAELFGFTTS